MRKALNSAFLQTDLDGAGKSIAALSDLQVGYKTTREVHIGKRLVGFGHSSPPAGSGTKDSPFDVSTKAKFDAFWNGLSSSYKWIVHLMDDEFETDGNLAWSLKANMRIVGRGMFQTSIKQMSLPGDDDFNFGVVSGDVDNVEVHDLQIDCNYTALIQTVPGSHTNANIYALTSRGGLFQNVRAIHSGGDMETFVIGMGSVGYQPNDAAREAAAAKFSRITGCRVELPDPGGHALTAISIAAGYFEENVIPMNDLKPWARRAEITDCYVDGGAYGTSPSHKISIAYQMGGYNGGVVQGCYARNCGSGFFQDTCPSRNLDIINNVFDGVSVGVLFNGGVRNMARGGTIGWNDIVTYNSGIALNSANHMTVDGNKIFAVDGATISAFSALIFQNKRNDSAADNSNNIYQHNRIDPAFHLAEVLPGNGATGSPRLWNNRYFDGSDIELIPDNYFPYNGPIAERIAARADAETLMSAQTIANNATATIDVSQPENDLIALDTNRVVAPADGTLYVNGHVAFSDVTSSGHVDLVMYVGVQSYAQTRKLSPAEGESYSVSLEVPVEEGDYVEFKINNQTGATLTIEQNYLMTYLMAVFVPSKLVD